MKQGEKTKLHIVEKSDALIYHQGYCKTSFNDIFNETGLSKGNITYHFKSKKDILEAIVQKRLETINHTLKSWEASSTAPVERLQLFCEMLIFEKESLKEYGCPMGTLTAEFSKYEPELYAIVLPMFERFREWLTAQYLLMGTTKKAADEKAMTLLSRVQGIAVVTHAFKDTSFLQKEIEKLKKEIKQECVTEN